MRIKPASHGFTLIEVLITIVIMGILSTMGLAVYQSTQKKARDLSRKTALTAVTKALEAYMNDKGFYPPSSPDGKILWCGTADDPESASCPWGTSFGDLTASGERTTYMAALPQEPAKNQNYFYEAVETDGLIKGYKLYGRLENTNDSDVTGPYGTLEDGVRCKSDGDVTCNYILTSETVAPPETCLVSGSACGAGVGTCCSPNSCTPFYAYSILLGYSDNCTAQNYCGNPNPLSFTATVGKSDGTTCGNWRECCSKSCNTYYDTSCTAGTYCGTTPPSGYLSSPLKSNGQSCSGGSECCSGSCTTFYTASCTTGAFCGTTPPSGYYTTRRLDDGNVCSAGSECCAGSCTTFYTASCTAGTFCGSTPPSGYYATRRADNGQTCTTGTDCCSGVCNTYYANGSCTAEKKCGATPPSGYGTTPSCCSPDGTACTLASSCCSGSCTTFYRDADGDGYGAGAAVQRCGGTLSGYVTNNTDCNDGNGSAWVLKYTDADNDGYCPNSTRVCVGSQAGYRTSCTAYNDCYDGNAGAYPGHVQWYATNRGDGSFDYNCDGVETKLWPVGDAHCARDGGCHVVYNGVPWDHGATAVRACGQTVPLLMKCDREIGMTFSEGCPIITTSSETQLCY